MIAPETIENLMPESVQCARVLTLGFQESEFRELEFSYFTGVQFKPLLMWATEEDIVEAAIEESSNALFLLVHSSFHANKLSDASLIRLSSVLPIVVADPSVMQSEGFTNFKKKDEDIEGSIIAQRVSFPLKDSDMNKCLVEFASRATLLNNINQVSTKVNQRTTDLYNEKKLVLNFLTDFIEQLNNSSNLQELFEYTRFAFEKIFSVQSLHIAFWSEDTSKVNYYLGLRSSDEDLFPEWEEYMNSIVRPIFSLKNKKSDFLAPEEEHTMLFRQHEEIAADFSYNTEVIDSFVNFALRPNMGYMLPLDLDMQGSRVGCLVLQLEKKADYGKEIAMAMELACSHLAYVFEKISSRPTNDAYMQKQSIDTVGRNFVNLQNKVQ